MPGLLGETGPVDAFLELLRDNSSVLGRLVTTAVVLAVALPVAALLGRLAARRGGDPYARYYLRSRPATPSWSRP